MSIQVRPDWESVKIEVMYRALKCKFSMHPHLKSMLCSTAGSILVEASPHDLFWGGGREGEGLNYLGRLLMQLRSEFLKENSKQRAKSSWFTWKCRLKMNIYCLSYIPMLQIGLYINKLVLWLLALCVWRTLVK